MSRCFPFPPPGYLRNSARRDALIESIKLRTEEMEKVNKEKEEKKAKKEKKREKKEKKKEKKERKQKLSTTSHSTDVAKKLKLIDLTKETKPDGKLQKVEDCDNELRERSGITEELELPVSFGDPCSSDSSQNSKRKRDTSLPPNHDHAPAIRRIRLPLRKHREPDETKQGSRVGSSCNAVTPSQVTMIDCQLPSIKKVETKQQFPGYSSCNGVTHSQVTKIDCQLPSIKKVETKQQFSGYSSCKSVTDSQLPSIKKVETKQQFPGYSSCNAVTHSQVTKIDCQLPSIKTVETKQQFPGYSVSTDCKALPNLVPADIPVTKKKVDILADIPVTKKKVDKESLRIESLYNSLFQSQIPPLLTYEAADQDWLFSSELTKEKPVSKKPKIDSDAFQCSKSLWPRAQYFPEVELYAMPYTVPF